MGFLRRIWNSSIPIGSKSLASFVKVSLFFLFICCAERVVEGRRGDPTSSEAPITAVPLKLDPDYQEIQWCVNGYDEPEFRRYPFSEFQPYLRRRHFVHETANIRYRYRVDLNPIQNDLELEGVDSIGAGGYMFQRAHFVFKVQLRDVFYHDIALRWRETKIEGLIVQANFAPHGVGLPFGQFEHPKFFSCVDCDKPLGIPVACRRRTHMHIVHPTILVYHHKMKPVQEHRDRQFKDCDEPKVKKQCILTDLVYDPPTTTTTTGATNANMTPDPTVLWWNKTVTPLSEFQFFPFFNDYDDQKYGCNSDADCQINLVNWFQEKCCIKVEGAVSPWTDFCLNNVHKWAIETMMPPPCMHDVDAMSTAMMATPDPSACVKEYKNAPMFMKPKLPCPQAQQQWDPPHPQMSMSYSPQTPEMKQISLSSKLDMHRDRLVFECKPFVVNVCREPDATRRVDYPEAYAIDHQTMMPPEPADKFNPFKVKGPESQGQCCYGTSPGSPDCVMRDVKGIPQPIKACKKKDPNASPAIVETTCVRRFLQPLEWELGARDDWKFKEDPDSSPKDCTAYLPPVDGAPDEYGPTNETHGNYAWYMPPCRTDPVPVKFQVLVVHSFEKGIYAIMETDDIYHLKRNPGSENENPYIPTPLFTGFKHRCDKQVPIAEYIYAKTTDTSFRISHSRSYNKCVQNMTGPHLVSDQSCPGIPKFNAPRETKKSKKRRPSQGTNLPPELRLIPRCDAKTYREDPLSCADVCPKLPISTTPEVPRRDRTFFKRTAHGAINIITNFCIMPICSFIARFYKETYNRHSFKGQKLWFWMHMVGAMVSTILMYLGFFSDRLVQKSVIMDPHHAWGVVYIFLLAVSYCTAWMRHKTRWVNMIVQTLHSLGGYSSILLAAVCIYYAEDDGVPINNHVKYICYAAVLILVVFYIGMTIHICELDRRFGMKPKRWHFPSVEAKFDDLPVPGGFVRKAFLYIILFINLPLTIATMFI